MSSKRVTITDVAREAGVSIKTVSNVINKGGSMRPETRARVEETMRRLGYRVNISARAMKAGRTRLIGLGINSFDQPFMPYFADSVIAAARRRGYGVITDTYPPDGGIEGIIEETYRLGADGWIFFVGTTLADGSAVLRQSYPVVAASDYALGRNAGDKVDRVAMPNEEAMHALAGELLDAGCRTIAVTGARVDGPDGLDRLISGENGTTAQRVRGFVRAMRERGLEPDWRYLATPSAWNRAAGASAVRSILDSGLPRPDAIMCLNDAAALGAITELQKRGLHVPDDIRVTGFDNVPEADFATPALTTIDPDVEGYARMVVDMLIERIEGFDGPSRERVTDYMVVRRASAC
ncbi:LacI family DNA-binding transcriptional regulator [Bifidobacterium avesanii]|uniref:LacI family DNA-binding transcriptional regulator n=1 Tax=Bifidobacterium avesanii TaxID=1798157 RepID=A0A7K3TJ20_9BIFI|nr:LacI family DNA-binding transcriptional regulator [Bifidobacterium avesanii]KAB8287396.1 LacI family transcriptional regulator [Bifidobacterium avesanii]NEG78689.1 LacI family DNA-binding transcriptional regulator [Bifidobacterium avesanii]